MIQGKSKVIKYNKFLRWLGTQLKNSSLKFVNVLTSVFGFNCQSKLS